MTGIPNYYIQIWEKYVGKVKPEGGDREDWIETCSRLCWGVRNLGEDAIVRVHGKTDLDSKRLIGLPHFGQVLNMPPIDQYADPSHADRYAINPNVRMLMHRRRNSVPSTRMTSNMRSLLLLRTVSRRSSSNS